MDGETVEVLGVELTGSGGHRIFVVLFGIFPSTGRPLCGGEFDVEQDAVAVAEFVERVARDREKVAEDLPGAADLLALVFVAAALEDVAASCKGAQDFQWTLEFAADERLETKFLPCRKPLLRTQLRAEAVQLADGRIYVVMRAGGGGVPLVHVWSADGGRTWTPPRPIDRRVCGVSPKLLKSADGTLALCYGRPGMYVMLDPSGTGEHWQVDNRFDLTDGERLTIETNARPFVGRPDCDDLMGHVNAPIETLDWMRPELLKAWYYSWENVSMCEVEPGRILVVYDLQNWVEKPGAAHRNAVRGVWIEKKGRQ